jgi:hypothetical protein
MAAGIYHLIFYQGEEYDRTFTIRDSGGSLVNLTGYTARLKIKSYVGGTALHTFTSGAEITLGGAAGTLRLNVLATATDDMTWNRAHYELELVPAGVEADAYKVLKGRAYCLPEINV